MKITLRFTTTLICMIALLSGGMAFAQSAAIDKAKSRLAAKPDSQDLRVNLVNAYLAHGKTQINSNPAAAVETLQAGVAAGQEGGSALADSSSAMADIRYALAYALVKAGKMMDALPVLDTLTSSNPDFDEARYLLGVTLVRSMTGANAKRGVEVLVQLAKDGKQGAQAPAKESAVVLAYNGSTVQYAAGNASGAMSMVSAVTTDFGNKPSGDATQNSHITYASGTYKLSTGDSDGALFDLDSLINENQDYKLKNGTTAKQVLANAYFQAALDSLAKGKDGADKALDMISAMVKLEGKESVEARHARAKAYELKGDQEGMKKEMEAIKAMDSNYHSKMSESK